MHRRRRVSELLFVYGTLKPIARQRGGRPAHVWGRMWENGSYPAIRLTDPGDGYLIGGLVSEVTEGDLAEFDRIEGVEHGWYRRVKARTVEGDEVWVYEGAGCLDRVFRAIGDSVPTTRNGVDDRSVASEPAWREEG